MTEPLIVRYTFNELLECRDGIDNNKAIIKLKAIFDQINNKNKPTIKTDLRHKLCCILNKLNTKNYKILLQEVLHLDISLGQISIIAGEIYRTALSNHNFTNLYILLLSDVVQYNIDNKRWCNEILICFLSQAKNDFECQAALAKYPKSFPKLLNGLYVANLVSYDLINCCVNELIRRKTDDAINTATLILMEQSVDLVPASFWVYFSKLKTVSQISNKTKYLIMDLGDKFNALDKMVNGGSSGLDKDKWLDDCGDDCGDETKYEKRAKSIILEYIEHTRTAQPADNDDIIDNVYYYLDDIEEAHHYIIIKYMVIYLFEHSQQHAQLQSLMQCLNDHILKSNIIAKGIGCIHDQLDDLEIDFPQCKSIYRDFVDKFQNIHI